MHKHADSQSNSTTCLAQHDPHSKVPHSTRLTGSKDAVLTSMQAGIRQLWEVGDLCLTSSPDRPTGLDGQTRFVFSLIPTLTIPYSVTEPSRRAYYWHPGGIGWHYAGLRAQMVWGGLGVGTPRRFLASCWACGWRLGATQPGLTYRPIGRCRLQRAASANAESAVDFYQPCGAPRSTLLVMGVSACRGPSSVAHGGHYYGERPWTFTNPVGRHAVLRWTWVCS